MRHGNLNSGNNGRRRHNASFQNEWAALANIFGVTVRKPTVLDHETFESRFKGKQKKGDTDAALIADYLLNGNQQSFTKLYYRYKDKMMWYIFFIVHDNDEAKDVLHNAWEKVLMAFKKHEYHEEGHFDSWFRKICHSEAKDWNIKKVRLLHGEEHLPERAANAMSIEQQLTNESIDGVLHEALNRLDYPEKDIVIMRILEGKSFVQISEITGLNINTVRTNYFRGKEKLKEIAKML